MADIVKYNSVSIQKIMANLDQHKYNPSGIQRASLDLLDEITDGEVDIVDATSPFVFLLESSAINTALAIKENVINLRKQYSRLSQTEDEVYMHLSDKDFINRFAVPSETDFTIVIQVNDLFNKSVYDEAEKCYKATIARDSEFKVDELVFTLQYPITIRKFDNGVVQISYDNTISSPLQTLTSNIIDYTVRADSNTVNWIFFKIPVQQFQIETTYLPVQQSSVFSYPIPYSNRYYYCRVFYRNNDTDNTWQEIITTHTDQVYDPRTPTAVLKVVTGLLTVFIPTIYLTTGLVSGEVRIDVYNTRGELTVNLSNYKLTSFQTRLQAIDEERDVSVYTNAMSGISFYSFSEEVISGGSNGIDFATLRERSINNSVGDRQLPITNVQLEAYVNNKGFDLVKNVDMVTNRIFLATKKLPKPINTKLITSANIGISTVIFDVDYLKTQPNVKDNTNRQTILSNNLYLNTNGKVTLLTQAEIDALTALPNNVMLDTINSRQYLYTPFYYVLDSSQTEFEIRAYNLDYPLASNLSFISQNQSLQLPVNTGSYLLEKTATGFKLTVVTKSGNFYKQLGDSQVAAQLAYYPAGETKLAYINGTQLTVNADGERVYSFDIITNYDIDGNNLLAITNAKMFTNESLKTWTALSNDFHIFYTTTSITESYVPDAGDALIGKFILPANSAAITHESLKIDLGTALKNLWVRSRSFATGLEYQTYEFDVPMVYTEVVYQIDPVTGSIFSFDAQNLPVYTILHNIGDPVLDGQDNPVYKHHAGDPMLDGQGNPIINTVLHANKEIDMLFVDGKYYFTTDSSFVSYRSELVAILDNWITSDISSIQKLLLEQTKIFFYPQTTLGLVKIYPDSDTEDYTASEQSLTVNLYVRNDVYDDNDIRQQLIDSTVKLLDIYINKIVVNLTEITLALKELYGDSVVSLNLSNLGGVKNYSVVSLANEHNRLCLKKKLVQQQDGSIIVKEDVTINFINIEKTLPIT